ncbi:hypothetical protein P691DRAFT_773147 [Macrolepiota fuliginosa MF-IS2]|uniref:DRBM domain-containing protein n=1 Tax=Macrolepiota fuliginosa MF-IS2 TaxID=1400762 RepID=A0A9P5XI54_9AGAR|nr:hypothetical protein P691DRAFT_773147 [Macrolepiota fuliginosa MF-IS2]
MSDTGQSGLNLYLQKRGRLTDLSWVDTSSGPRHEPQWTSICKIQGEPRGTGSGPKKRVARDIAANTALASLKEEESAT